MMAGELRIIEFRGQWTKFSNYSVCSVWFDGHLYTSVEHAYQAAKSLDEKVRSAIRHLPKPNQAKKAGRGQPFHVVDPVTGEIVAFQLTLRPDWEQVKVQVMRELLAQKFAQEPERSILKSSGRQELVEGNWWGDTFWGQCPVGNGENWLGRLLMELRETL